MTISGFIRSLFTASALAGMVLVNAAAASIIPGYPDAVETAFDAREVALLPHYCIYTKLFRLSVPGGDNKAEIDRWRAAMGPAFDWMHHYCWGLMKTNRALLLAKDKQTKTFYLKDAISEFDYFLNRASPSRDFVLLPELFTKKGENLIRLGRGVEGVTELERAIELKRDYWPPYADLSDYYESKGDVPKAREVLKAGLSYAPDAKALTRRLAELDSAKEKKKPSQRETSGG
jgi:tetratricopeptide (TPR) repeat protein